MKCIRVEKSNLDNFPVTNHWFINNIRGIFSLKKREKSCMWNWAKRVCIFTAGYTVQTTLFCTLDGVKTRTRIFTKCNKAESKPTLEFRERIHCLPDEKMHTLIRQETDFTGYIFFSFNVQRKFKYSLWKQF